MSPPSWLSGLVSSLYPFEEITMDNTFIEIEQTIDDSMFFDISVPLSYSHYLWFMILGNRGCGKSYGTKKYAIERFLKYGEQFAYVRRSDKDLEKTNPKFFNDMYDVFPDHELKVKGMTYMCDGKIMGYAYSLSTSLGEKSAPVPKVDFIIFDEFLVDTSVRYQSYLPNEIYLIANLYETIARPLEGGKRVPMFMLANVISVMNPYFLEFDIRLPSNKKKIATNKSRRIYMQIVDNPKYKKAKQNSDFYDVIKGTSYEASAINNEFIRDKYDFIIPPPKKLHYMFTLLVKGKYFGVSFANSEGYYYVSDKYDPNNNFIVTTLFEDHTPNTLMLKGARKSPLFADLQQAFNIGRVFYRNLDCQQAVIESMKGAI